jgi:hypothetical protein
MLTAGEIAHALGGRRSGAGAYVAKCPAHEDRSPSLSLRDTDDGRALFHCHAGCDPCDVIEGLRSRGLWETREHTGVMPKPKARPAPKPSVDKSGKARWLWQRSRPIQATVAEIYLRAERGITCPLPATLRFLPASDQHPPSMIAPFLIPAEIAPGKLAVNSDHVDAVHITRLTPDGRKHPDDPAKITLGSASGLPIVLAPMNDLLGLAITEGTEDALSVHQVTGLGAWAAGTAGRLPALAEAVPRYCDCVTIFADGDTAGTDNSMLLAERLDARSIHVEILPLAQVPR